MAIARRLPPRVRVEKGHPPPDDLDERRVVHSLDHPAGAHARRHQADRPHAGRGLGRGLRHPGPGPAVGRVPPRGPGLGELGRPAHGQAVAPRVNPARQRRIVGQRAAVQGEHAAQLSELRRDGRHEPGGRAPEVTRRQPPTPRQALRARRELAAVAALATRRRAALRVPAPGRKGRPAHSARKCDNSRAHVTLPTHQRRGSCPPPGARESRSPGPGSWHELRPACAPRAASPRPRARAWR